MVEEGTKSRIRDLCGELVRLLGLRQGHVEIHCHAGAPKQVHVMDKSLKFEEPYTVPSDLTGPVELKGHR